MAHKERYVHVGKSFRGKTANGDSVTDPVCNRVVKKADSRHVLFQRDKDLYFCSRECLDRFIYMKHRRELREDHFAA